MVKSLLLLLLVVLLAAGSVLYLVVQDAPSVMRSSMPSPESVGTLQMLSAANDPRRLEPGESGTLMLAESDLTLMLGYALERLQAGQADVVLGEQGAVVRVSTRLPLDFAELYLNFQATVVGADGLPTVSGVTVGDLQVPDWLSQPLLTAMQATVAERYPEYRQLQAAIEEVQIDTAGLRVRYVWDPALVRQLSRRGGELLLPGLLLERVSRYREQLRNVGADQALARRVSATRFLQPLFMYARDTGGDAVEENRALLLALSLYALEVDPLQVLVQEEVAESEALPEHELQLYRRSDLARHFFAAVGLTLGTDAGLADSIGLLKELEDARGSGSGFSFADIGADRMGARFAELAVAGAAQAKALQHFMAVHEGEAHYFPDFRDLPEFLSQAQFESAYGSTGSAGFLQEMEKIDFLISDLPVFSAVHSR